MILVIVNFIVITKGATRIAEVGARFTLDAIPGKQMSIDADLSAGMINDKEAQLQAARAGGGKLLLRLDGRRLEIRARRRHRRPHHHRHQHHRRHRHRLFPARHGDRRSRRRVRQAVGRRRPGHPDPGADRLAGRRPAGLQGRHARLGRPGRVRPARRLSARALRRGLAAHRAGHDARPADAALLRAGRRHGGDRLHHPVAPQPPRRRSRQGREGQAGEQGRGGAQLGQVLAEDRRDRASDRQAAVDQAA